MFFSFRLVPVTFTHRNGYVSKLKLLHEMERLLMNKSQIIFLLWFVCEVR